MWQERAVSSAENLKILESSTLGGWAKKVGQKSGSTLLAGSFEAVQGRIQDSLGWKGQRSARFAVQVSGQDLSLTLVEGKQLF